MSWSINGFTSGVIGAGIGADVDTGVGTGDNALARHETVAALRADTEADTEAARHLPSTHACKPKRCAKGFLLALRAFFLSPAGEKRTRRTQTRNGQAVEPGTMKVR